jgi:lipopolysaccharide/colanic/teichoic acid biosynthesis glycosyltransferase
MKNKFNISYLFDISSIAKYSERKKLNETINISIKIPCMLFINLIFNSFKVILGITLFLILLPLLVIFSFLIYFEDKANPIFSGFRVGQNFKLFKLYKLRSMLIRNNIGHQSTSNNDNRILKIGKIIRKTKIDELLQIINVIKRDINFVGPRPNVLDEVNKYIDIEKKLLDYKPGITDFSSIIFSDEGAILKNSTNPDLDYNLLIRPRKNLIALLYFKDNDYLSDIFVVLMTIWNILNRKSALKIIYKYMKKRNDSIDFNFILRDQPLTKINNLERYFKPNENKFF